jgi:hypothetical protein
MLFCSHPLHRGLTGALDPVPSAVLAPTRPFYYKPACRLTSEQSLKGAVESFGLQKPRDVATNINVRPSGRRGPQVRGDGAPFGIGELRVGGHCEPVGPPSGRLAQSRSRGVILRALQWLPAHARRGWVSKKRKPTPKSQDGSGDAASRSHREDVSHHRAGSSRYAKGARAWLADR